MPLIDSKLILSEKLREIDSDINYLENKNNDHQKYIDGNTERLQNLYQIKDDLVRSITLLNQNS
jgi:hypothetical protein